MEDNRFANYDDEIRDLVLDFERTVMQGESQFYDVDEFETIIDYYFEVNDKEPLIQALVYAEQMYPDSSEIKQRRAHWYISNGKFDRAKDILLTLEEHEPENTDIAYSLGVLYGEMGNSEKAIDYYLMAATDGWQTGRIYENIAEEYYTLQRFDDAIEYYCKALKNDGSSEDTLYNYLDTCEQAECIEDAVSFLDNYAHDHPYSKVAWYCLGCAYADIGLYDRAEESLELAIAIDKRYSLAYNELSHIQEYNGQIGQAASTLLHTLDFTTNASQVYSELGMLYGRHENIPTAIYYLHKSLKANPDNADALGALAMCHLQLDDISMASTYISKTLTIDPENPDAVYCSALICDAAGEYQKACEIFEQLLDSYRCQEYHFRAYADFLYRHNDLNTLEQFIDDYLRLAAPNDSFYITYQAACFFRTNRYNRLKQVLPHVDSSLLYDICPEMWQNTNLIPLLPPVDRTAQDDTTTDNHQ